MLDNSHKKVVVGMSGGVDSSVSAWLLQQQGYRVEGLFMKNWEEDDNEKYCISTNDLADVRSVCNTLGIYLHTVNFSAEYWDNVFINFINEYQLGRTPNPDVLCNKEIKFKTFLDFALDDLGADYIATGHYARRASVDNKYRLLRGVDDTKDQSYFLYTLGQKQLSRCLFPVGELIKSRVRCIATDIGLSIAYKKDSTGLCFIGKRKFRDFISRYLPPKPGKILSVHGHDMGFHQGLMYYTLGQRKGLHIGGTSNGNGNPWYVVEKHLEQNQLIVAQGKSHPCLMSVGLTANQLHWIDGKIPTEPLSCAIKIRHCQNDFDCLVIPQTNGNLKVNFKNLISSVTPGQSVVFYLKEHCIGGGIIETRLPFVC